MAYFVSRLAAVVFVTCYLAGPCAAARDSLLEIGETECEMDCKGALDLERQWGFINYDDIPRHLQPGLRALGWNETSWDSCKVCYKGLWGWEGFSVDDCLEQQYLGDARNEYCPASEPKLFRELSAEEKQAAVSLGYTEGLWDASSPHSCCHSCCHLVSFGKDNSDTLKCCYLP